MCWHSRGTVVWEQLSHLAPAESRRYQTGWLLNSLRVCVCFCFFFLHEHPPSRVHLCDEMHTEPPLFFFLPQSDTSFFPLPDSGFFSSIRPSASNSSFQPPPCSSQCVTCSPPVTFHPCLPHSLLSQRGLHTCSPSVLPF